MTKSGAQPTQECRLEILSRRKFLMPWPFWHQEANVKWQQPLCMKMKGEIMQSRRKEKLMNALETNRGKARDRRRMWTNSYRILLLVLTIAGLTRLNAHANEGLIKNSGKIYWSLVGLLHCASYRHNVEEKPCENLENRINHVWKGVSCRKNRH